MRELKKDDIIYHKYSNITDEDNAIRIIDVKFFAEPQSLQDPRNGTMSSANSDGREKSKGYAWVYDGIFCRKMSLEEIEANYLLDNRTN